MFRTSNSSKPSSSRAPLISKLMYSGMYGSVFDESEVTVTRPVRRRSRTTDAGERERGPEGAILSTGEQPKPQLWGKDNTYSERCNEPETSASAQHGNTPLLWTTSRVFHHKVHDFNNPKTIPWQHMPSSDDKADQAARTYWNSKTSSQGNTLASNNGVCLVIT